MNSLKGCHVASANTENEARIVHVTRSLEREMGLRRPTRIFVSPRKSESPYALGAIGRSATLVVPVNLWELAKRACVEDETQAISLLRLVLAHELAHVRNGDVRFLPLLFTLRYSLPWCSGALLLIYFVVRVFKLDDSVILITSPTIALLSISTLILILLLRYALTRREKLADATATLYVDPKALRELINESQQTGQVSILKRFLFFLQAGTMFSRAIMGFDLLAKRGRWRKEWHALFVKRGWLSSLDSRTVRARAIQNKTFAVPISTEPETEAACVVGVLGGVVMGAASVIILNCFVCHMLTQHPATDENLFGSFLKSVSSWTARQKTFEWKIFRSLTPVCVGILIAGGMLLPLRDTKTSFRRLSWKTWAKLTIISLFALLMVSLTFSIIANVFRPPFPFFAGINISTFAVWWWTPIIMLMFLTFLVLRNSVTPARFLQLSKESCVGLAWIALAMTTGIFLLKSLDILGRIMWPLAACALVASAWQFQVLHANEPFSDESLRYLQLLWWRKVVSNPLGGLLRLTRQYFRWLVGLGFVVYFMPTVIVILSLRPWLVSFDKRFLSRQGEREHKLRTLGRRAPDALREHRFTFTLEYVPLYVSHSIGSSYYRPSTLVGMAALMGTMSVGLLTFTFGSLRGRKRHERTLQVIPGLVELLHLLPLEKLRVDFRNDLEAALDATISATSPYVAVTGAPLMRRTCRTVECAYLLCIRSTAVEAMITWIRRCKLPSGGFGASPGCPANLLHTVSALRVLRRISALDDGNPAIHTRWLRRALVKCVRPREPMNESDWLEATRLCLEGLEILATLETRITRRLLEKIAREAISKWGRTSQTVQDARNLLQITSYGESKRETVRHEIREQWLPGRELHLPTMSPDALFDETAGLVSIIAMLFPESYLHRNTVSQLADNLEKAYALERSPKLSPVFTRA